MNYKQILNHMKGLKSFPYWKYGAPWLRMAYDRQTQCLFLTHRENYQIKNSWQGIEDSPMVIRPDNTVLLPTGEVSGVILGTFGIAGRFRHQARAVVRDIYQHECMANYEAFPGLMLDFKTGKPLNSRLIDEIRIDPEKRKEVDAKLKTLRTMYISRARVSGTELKRDWNIIPKPMHYAESRDNVIFNVLENLPPSWADSLTKVLMYFAANTRKGNWKADVDPGQAFDSMVKFHKSAIYRHFGVTY